MRVFSLPLLVIHTRVLNWSSFFLFFARARTATAADVHAEGAMGANGHVPVRIPWAPQRHDLSGRLRRHSVSGNHNINHEHIQLLFITKLYLIVSAFCVSLMRKWLPIFSGGLFYVRLTLEEWSIEVWSFKKNDNDLDKHTCIKFE